MPVSVSISISFTAESTEAAQSVVDGLTLPEGAYVSATVSEPLASGQVDSQGNIATGAEVGTAAPPPEPEQTPEAPPASEPGVSVASDETPPTEPTT